MFDLVFEGWWYEIITITPTQNKRTNEMKQHQNNNNYTITIKSTPNSQTSTTKHQTGFPSSLT
eukprot:m.144956 g.144956  ORF g.144956 m.144956 type:complete len:63 (+) comp30403_c0_seq3:29-217(+)